MYGIIHMLSLVLFPSWPLLVLIVYTLHSGILPPTPLATSVVQSAVPLQQAIRLDTRE
jgi:hypothetical protein